MSSKTTNILILTTCILIGLVVGAFFLALEFYTPDTKVEKWEHVSSRGQQQIMEMVKPVEGETFQFFYSLGLVSFKEDGNLVTDRRVVSYVTDEDGEVFYDEAYYENIQSMSVEKGSSWLDDTTITIHMEDELDDFDLYFSTEGKGDRPVIDYLKTRIRSRSDADGAGTIFP